MFYRWASEEQEKQVFGSGERITKPSGLAKDQMADSGIGSSGPENRCNTTVCRWFCPGGRHNWQPAGAIGPFIRVMARPPNRLIRPRGWPRRVHRGDSMPAIATDPMKTVPSIVPSDIPTLSDDECLRRLAQVVETHDSDHLDEVALLIGRLAVTIE